MNQPLSVRPGQGPGARVQGAQCFWATALLSCAGHTPPSPQPIQLLLLCSKRHPHYRAPQGQPGSGAALQAGLQRRAWTGCPRLQAHPPRSPRMVLPQVHLHFLPLVRHPRNVPQPQPCRDAHTTCTAYPPYRLLSPRAAWRRSRFPGRAEGPAACLITRAETLPGTWRKKRRKQLSVYPPSPARPHSRCRPRSAGSRRGWGPAPCPEVLACPAGW